jgi:hypothetical protein
MNRPSTRAGGGLLLSLGLAIGVVAACSSPAASGIPSLTIPSLNPSITVPSLAVPSELASAAAAACLPASTFAILDQAKASGADVQSILTTNKDALLASLNSFQPTDPAVVTWKTNLVNALQSGSMSDAATQLQALASGQVSVSSC